MAHEVGKELGEGCIWKCMCLKHWRLHDPEIDREHETAS